MLLTIEQWEMLKWKSRSSNCHTYNLPTCVVIPGYCWSAFWGYVSKRNCLEKHFCCYGYCYSSNILAFGCDHRNLQVLSVTLTLNEVVFIYNKQLVINIIARTSSHLSSLLVITGIQRGVHMSAPSLSHAAFLYYRLHPPNPYLSSHPAPAAGFWDPSCESSECRLDVKVFFWLDTDQMWYINIPW